MTFSFCLEMLFPKQTFADRIHKAHLCGVEAIEMWGWRDKDLKTVAQALKKNKMTLTNMSGNRQYSMIDPADFEGFVGEIRDTAAIARKLGCSRLMLLTQALLLDNSAKSPTKPMSDGAIADQMVIAGCAAAEVADELSLEIVIEPLNSVLDHPGFLLNSSRKAFELIKQIGHPRVKMLYDVYHMAMMREDVLADVSDNLQNIGYLHLADMPGRHEPGSGKINFGLLADLLHDTHYDGVVGFEFSPSGDSAAAIQRTKQAFLGLPVAN